MATKQVRWKCPTCGNGVLAPSRPRMNDVRRYCLPCSGKAGILVMRTAPALDRARADRAAAQRLKEQKQREAREAKKEATRPMREARRDFATKTAEGLTIKTEAQRLWKLLTPYHKGQRMPSIEVKVDTLTEFDGRFYQRSRGNSGMAFMRQNRLWVKGHCAWETLAHELVHVAVGSRHNDNGRRCVHDETFYYALKDLAERRFKVSLSFFGVTRWGYNVDYLIEKQLRSLGVFEKQKV